VSHADLLQKLFLNLVANIKVLHIQLNGAKYVLGPKTTFHTVEQFPDKINCVTLHLVGYILKYYYDARTHEH
jgi:hypothetical protein